ncbi:LysE/ArgO family amino acid transporter [Rhodovulum sp. YNF3179]|uniref:LysE/ArgO family amino acid transporter n=1 Tax=Rhodovulum sp. YNF3179 TaxID=3425127 RepID=UPI003D348E90
MIGAAVTGYLTALSLILAIGAQNAFVLRQGLMRRHVLALVLFCAVSDAVLITAGVLGFGRLVALWPGFPTIMALAGAAFLVVYGLLRFRDAWIGSYSLDLDGGGSGFWPTMLTAAAITWANPHVYLDTLGLIGAISTQYAPAAEKAAFATAAVAASFTFFFALGYGARLLAPVMRTPRTWRVLDAGIGAVMWAIAAGLLASVF